jgi:hypothetical protein
VSAVDCDVHPDLPGIKALLPYLDEFWRESLVDRGIDSLDTINYPPNAPITARPDWRGANGRAGTELAALQTQALDRWQSNLAICNCLAGVQLVFNEDMARAMARAVNDWMAREWLDRDPRLRASIVVSNTNVEFAVEEIERCAADKRFVQVLMLAMDEVPLGRRSLWPIYAAAEKQGLPIGIHAGSAYKHPPTSLGWNNFYIEDYASQSQGFQSQVASLICEGVFVKHPKLKVVLIESGVTWAPAFLWRLTKFWRGCRTEVPWVDRPPSEIFRQHFRMTIQPLDAPDAPGVVARFVDHLQSDQMLLYSSDYPHWQFDGDELMPPGLPETLRRKIMVDNPLSTYGRLQETVQ